MLPRHRFESSVSQYQGDYYTKHFTSWNQDIIDLLNLSLYKLQKLKESTYQMALF